jgi:hypothetical protein
METANPEAIEHASEDDRAWFEANPSETVRYRAAFPGELPAAAWEIEGLAAGVAASRHVEVTRIAPGVRVRRPWLALTLARSDGE